MKKNIGKTDRTIRIIVGIVLGLLGLWQLPTWWGIVLLIVGILLIVTGAIGFCYLYTLLKKSTK